MLTRDENGRTGALRQRCPDLTIEAARGAKGPYRLGL